MLKNLAIMVFWAMMITSSSEAWGFRFTSDFERGFYWGSLPVRMDVVAANASDGNQLASLVSQAVNAWESATGSQIWEVQSGWSTSSQTGNAIRWSNNFAAETGYDPSVTLAVTIRYASGTYFSKTEIVLNGQNSSLRANSNNLLWKTILHEMGHTIGLDHSDQVAIMAPYVGSLTSLQFDDVSGMNSLIDKTQNRQATGYVSPVAAGREDNASQFAACGSIGGLSGGSSGGGGSSGPFIFSLIAGLMMFLIKPRRNKFPH